MVQILGERRVGDGRAVGRHGIRGLGEEEWRLALALAHFPHMFEIVAADAPDAPHRK